MQDQRTADCRKDRFGRQNDGRGGRFGILLPENLTGVRHAGRHKTAVRNRNCRRTDCREGYIFGKQGENPVDDRADGELRHGKTQRVNAVAEMVDQHNVDGINERADDEDRVAGSKRQRTAVETDEIQTDDAEDRADPGLQIRLLTDENADHRDKDHVQTGDEARFSGGVGEVNADLLEKRRRTEQNARNKPGLERRLLFDGIVRTLFEQKDDGNQRQRPEKEACAVESKRADIIRAEPLCSESEPPNDRRSDKEDNALGSIFLGFHE